MLKHNRRRFFVAMGCALMGTLLPAQEQSVRSTSEILDMLARYPRDGGLMILLRQAVSEETDMAILPRALAVYSLACLNLGRNEEGNSARDTLLRRFPDSDYAAMLHVDAMGAACPSCRGEGRLGIACAECGGNGNCSMCGGRGSISHRIGTTDEICTQCNGAGQCPRCLGAGQLFRLCNRCEGQGMILEMNKIRSVYRKALAGLPSPEAQETADPDPSQPGVVAPIVRPPRDPSTWDEEVIRFF